MLSALGFKFLDTFGNEIKSGIEGVYDLVEIDDSKVDYRIKEAKFDIACDVDNPLNGRNGSAYVYGPQKGASPKQAKIIVMIKAITAGIIFIPISELRFTPKASLVAIVFGFGLMILPAFPPPIIAKSDADLLIFVLLATASSIGAVSYTHLTLPTTPYV